jgi:hypothetical protein
MAFSRSGPEARQALDQTLRVVLLEGGLKGLQVGRNAVPTLDDDRIWSTYASRELLPAAWPTALAEIGRRYRISGLDQRWLDRIDSHVDNSESLGLAYDASAMAAQRQRAAASIGSRAALELLPDQEFLTAYGAGVAAADLMGKHGPARANYMLAHAEQVFQTYGLPYAVRDRTIIWSGDALTRQTVIEPALDALEDPRITGARAEFDLARAALRAGTPDKLRDATHEAGNSVEAVLIALLTTHQLDGPRSRTAASLFNVLRDARVLPPSLEFTVMAAPQLRNAQGGHTQGATITSPERRIAEAAVSAAAVAITLLVSYLP